MEKSNELNKFLSYIHMGNSVFRIYYESAKKLKNKKLTKQIKEVQEIFKKHEEQVTSLINDLGEEATNSLTSAGIMGVFKEKLKSFDDSYTIIYSAIQSVNLGTLSALKFLNQNKELKINVRTIIESVIKDYSDIQTNLINYFLKEIVY